MSAIVLFCGNAARDERQKNLPRGFLSRLHGALLRRLRTLDAEVYVARHDDQSFLVGDAVFTIGTLGSQIETALRHCFDRGHERVLIVAGDAPIDERIVQRALDATSPVIAASRDGGFALAGFSELPSIDWDDVVADRAHAAQALRACLPFNELPRVDDIDTLDDARRLLRDVPRGDFAPFIDPTFPRPLVSARAAPRAPPGVGQALQLVRVGQALQLVCVGQALQLVRTS
ncbi:MAG TPA: DUF2064 domain-containing protein [Thermoanaerobaculia bacterium]|nr:DUF2064 domain-containing protein [Thermoanaerobaculia bacterium]